MINIDNIPIEVTQKNIRSIRLTVHPPHGEVRISAPHAMTMDAIQHFVRSKIGWIRKHQERIQSRTWTAPLQYVTGEKHLVFGKEFILEVRTGKKGKVILTADAPEPMITLIIPPRAGKKKRQEILEEWYRDQLRKVVPAMIERYEPLMNVSVASWGIKKMKTKWGTCNITDRRIWLNLELAKKSLAGVEHVVVHEMVHLLERKHNARFKGLMDRFYPEWRERAKIND